MRVVSSSTFPMRRYAHRRSNPYWDWWRASPDCCQRIQTGSVLASGHNAAREMPDPVATMVVRHSITERDNVCLKQHV
jgi:hypothetical protein